MSTGVSKKRARSDESLVVSGWKEYQVNGVKFLRSFPGQPSRERHFVYDKPYVELTDKEGAAALNVLGIYNEETWELAMPRRVKAHCDSVVLAFQAVTWDGLSTEQQQEAQTQLQISKSMWNKSLSPFHDDLWTVEGLGLSSKEFSTVLGTIEKLIDRTVVSNKVDLARFLLGLEKVLTPSPGLQIVDAIKAKQCWEALEDSCSSKVSTHIVVASFLSDPDRFVDYPHLQLLPFWNDDASGCYWGNASGRTLEAASTVPLLVPYATALNERYRRRLELRRCAGPILTGTIPSGRLPRLPQAIALDILNDWVGHEEAVDPFTVDWLPCYQRTLASLLPPPSASAAAPQNSNIH